VTAETYRVELRYRPRFSNPRQTWRLLVTSLSSWKLRYSVHVDIIERPDLDARCLGISLGFAETDPPMQLLVESAFRQRRTGKGETKAERFASRILVVPIEAQTIADDDIWTIWAEWREMLRRTPYVSITMAAEEIDDLLAGVVRALTPRIVAKLIEANHAP